MKTNLKRRICLLTLPGILASLPQAELTVQAAGTVYLNWSSSVSINPYMNPEFQMTKQTTGFYIGDYLTASESGNGYKNYGALSLNSGVKYKSDKTSVVTINKSTGLVKAKKNGTAKITITFKGVSKTCTIKVVSKISKLSGNYNTLKKSADALIKTYGKKLTSSNRYQAINANYLYINACESAPYTSNFNFYSGLTSSYQNGKSTYIAHLPMLAHASVISSKIDTYATNLNPIGTGNAKIFRLKSVSGKGSTVTIKLSKNTTEEQMFGLKAAASNFFDSKIDKSNKVKFPIYIQDVKTRHKYYGLATATKGKNIISVKLQSLKLKKGSSYTLIGMKRNSCDNWPSNQKFGNSKKNNTFKAK